MKPLNDIFLFLIPKRIGYTVWFAPFFIALGIYFCLKGDTSIGIGPLVGGILLVAMYFLRLWFVQRKNKHFTSKSQPQENGSRKKNE